MNFTLSIRKFVFLKNFFKNLTEIINFQQQQSKAIDWEKEDSAEPEGSEQMYFCNS